MEIGTIVLIVVLFIIVATIITYFIVRYRRKIKDAILQKFFNIIGEFKSSGDDNYIAEYADMIEAIDEEEEKEKEKEADIEKEREIVQPILSESANLRRRLADGLDIQIIGWWRGLRKSNRIKLKHGIIEFDKFLTPITKPAAKDWTELPKPKKIQYIKDLYNIRESLRDNKYVFDVIPGLFDSIDWWLNLSEGNKLYYIFYAQAETTGGSIPISDTEGLRNWWLSLPQCTKVRSVRNLWINYIKQDHGSYIVYE
jgi:hypothetical protein